MTAPGFDWDAANRAALAAEFASLQGRAAAPQPALRPPARLDSLAAAFALDAAARRLLVLAAAAELEPEAGDRGRPTVAAALALAGTEGWAALCPQAPLRRWRMVELEGAGPVRERLLRLDERITHHLIGIDYLDPRLDGLVEPLPAQGPAEAGVVERLVAAWASPQGRWSLVQLAAGTAHARRAAFAQLCAMTQLRPFRLAAADIPRGAFERAALARLADREMVLSRGALLIELRDQAAEEETLGAATLADLLHGPTALAAREPVPVERDPRLRADLPAATPARRQAIWADALGPVAATLGTRLDDLAHQFALDEAGVRSATEGAGGGALFERLWDGARLFARQRLDGLAERIESGVGWEDLVLPPDRLEQLRDIAVHVRRAALVHERWGWAAKGTRGLGVAALFAGPSGTGKTLAAEVLATELRLDLFRVDLSQVVSKYIGETEKNLRRIFEAAEAGGAILLFDEADALFGKRSEVKDSHDRYANVEVSYLLQRMEAYRGLAILTTNMRSALDAAFMRRLRFVVDFPFPDAGLRGAIWSRIFPAATPTAGLDPARLARLAIAGGGIRSIALNAAFMAAEAGQPVGMLHLLHAARREYAKMEKSVTVAEFGEPG
jgi:vesicle-fusing ATPase